MFIYRLMTISDDFVAIIAVIIAFVLSACFAIVAHEVSHAWVAKLNGDYTAENAGRLTLNPVAHFDPIGLLMMLLVGFGWAKPVPINPNNFTKYRRGMITVAAAGVTANLLLAGISLLLLFLLQPLLLYAASTSTAIYFLQILVLYLINLSIMFNFMLALFNLLPIYPLDGYNIVASLFPQAVGYRRFMVRYGVFVLLALILIGNIASFAGFRYLNVFGLFGDVINKLISLVSEASVKTFLG